MSSSRSIATYLPGQSDPVLAKMVLEDGWDLVDASRLKGKPRAMPWINYLGNRVFAIAASLLFGARSPICNSGMRAIARA